MKKVIVDADGLIALFSSDDAHAEHALRLLERLTAQEAQLLHPTTAIVEAITTLQRKLHRPELAAIISLYRRRTSRVVIIVGCII